MSSQPPFVERVVTGALACIAIEGPDAHDFAQSQFSGDLDLLGPGHWRWNAWLDAKGRVLALMQLTDAGDGRLLAILRGGDPVQALATLQRYVFRRNVALAARSYTASWGAPLAMGRVELAGSSQVLGLGARSMRLAPGPARVDPVASEAWRLQDIRCGWPMLPASGAAFLPPALGLEHLGAVSFDKGCYPGQEVAARLHYRGGHKLRLHQIRGAAALPPPGPVRTDAGPVTVLTVAGHPGGSAGLIVGPTGITSSINILHHTYMVESTFDA